MNIFKSRGVFIDVYKGDDQIATSGATSLADINLRKTSRPIDNVVTVNKPYLFCANDVFSALFAKIKQVNQVITAKRYYAFIYSGRTPHNSHKHSKETFD